MLRWLGIILTVSLSHCLFLNLVDGHAAENPEKLAAEGRFDLLSDDETGDLTSGDSDTAGVKVERMNWLPAKNQSLGFVVSGPISYRGWREWRVSFVPKNNGRVTLTLKGPWEQSPSGEIYRQLVLWDAIEVTGGKLANGSFEESERGAQGAKRVGWDSHGGGWVMLYPKPPPVDGKVIAKTWHDGAMQTQITVEGGKRVTIKLHVCAYRHPGSVEIKPIAERNTPAHRAAQRFRRGANFGNELEVPPGQDWGAKHSAQDVEHVKAEGFDHIRLPIAWHHYAAGSDFRLSQEIFDKVDLLVAAAVKNRLGIILNIHHFDRFTSNPTGELDKFLKLWRQIAEHYADRGDLVAFELLNEPKDAATTEVLNPIYAEAIKVIRQTNLNRTIFVGPGKWNSAFELSNLRLSDDDLNLIVTVHCYEPFYFTHQGASWAGADAKTTGIRFPGPPDKPLVLDPDLKLNSSVVDWIERYNTLPTAKNPSSPSAFRGHVAEATEWSVYYGRPIHFGEFGAFERADAASRANYYREFRETLDQANLGWAIWDWKAGFRYWDAKASQPLPGLREALFPKTEQ